MNVWIKWQGLEMELTSIFFCNVYVVTELDPSLSLIRYIELLWFLAYTVATGPTIREDLQEHVTQNAKMSGALRLICGLIIEMDGMLYTSICESGGKIQEGHYVRLSGKTISI